MCEGRCLIEAVSYACMHEVQLLISASEPKPYRGMSRVAVVCGRYGTSVIMEFMYFHVEDSLLHIFNSVCACLFHVWMYAHTYISRLAELIESKERYRRTEDEVSCTWCPRCGVCIFLVSMWWYLHIPFRSSLSASKQNILTVMSPR